jgi:hypothetical protein
MLRQGGCPDARLSAMISATIPSIRSQLFFFDRFQLSTESCSI